jgi:hypothetical protein
MKIQLLLGVLLLITIVSANPCQRYSQYPQFVADDEFDAVEICGVCYICKWPSDNVCPEDYEYNGKRGSCIARPDGDCVARVNGTVFSRAAGQEIVGATITFFPPPGSGAPNDIYYTDGEGDYFVENIAAGRWIVRVEKEGYDTEIREEIIEYGKTNVLDFYLPLTTCNSDCTNSFGICSAACDGVNTCNYVSEEIKTLCDDLDPGTEVIINETGDFVNKIVCCNNNNDATTLETEFRPKAIVNGQMDTLVQREIVAKWNNDIVKIKIAIWE